MKTLRSENVLNVSVRRRDVALLHVSGGAADPRGSDRRRRMDGLASLPPRLRLSDPGSVLVGHLVSGFVWSLRLAAGAPTDPENMPPWQQNSRDGRKKKRILFSVLTIITCGCLSGTFYVTFFLFL